MSETQELPPLMLETSMTGPLGGAVGDPGAPTTYVGDVDDGALERRCRRLGSAHHLCRRRRWWAPLRGTVKDPGAPTTYVGDVDRGPPGRRCQRPGVPPTYVRDVDGGAPGRRCRRPKSAQHLCQRRRWWAL
jgi:hypothetical protein